MLRAGLADQIWRRNGGTLRIAWKRSRKVGLGCRPGAAGRGAAGIAPLCTQLPRQHSSCGRRWRMGASTLGAQPVVATLPAWRRPAAFLPGARALSIPLSILDLDAIPEGNSAREAIASSMASARLADRLGYNRLWFAEHHNTPNLAASATALLISGAASVTERIRVGAGGVMLPNHAPLMVAEQYGTLANMHGDRIDLGLGRAPGTDPMTAQALGRSSAEPQAFAQSIYDLQGWFGPEGQARSMPIVSAVSEGTEVPIWVLGSTVSGASIAGQLGLPFSLASHFAPDQIDQAIQVYRESFKTDAPTARIDRPYIMAGINMQMAVNA